MSRSKIPKSAATQTDEKSHTGAVLTDHALLRWTRGERGYAIKVEALAPGVLVAPAAPRAKGVRLELPNGARLLLTIEPPPHEVHEKG